MTGPIPGGAGETAVVYQVTQFRDGMARLAHLFRLHPELKGLRATVDEVGHVDIIAVAEAGVLHDWIHALPAARREKALFSIHSGLQLEEVLRDGPLTVHVRPKPGA
ncbi:hypothetical protein [Streptomyces sp.]|uniref:hypothetical protein n=1 Tax=Streptomyces sp. TaxID=1931 RepID=UPI002F954515